MQTDAATHLYIVRHGETDFNRQGIVQGRGVNTSLNETGQAQAQALAERFAGLRVDAIYSSPLMRALQTATCVADACGGMPIETDLGLEEMSWGVFEGQPRSEKMLAAFDEMRQRWHAGELDFAVEGGESCREVQTRGFEAIHRIMADHPQQHVLVVAHGRFLRILLATLLEEYGTQRMEELNHTNTGVNHIVYDGQKFHAKLLNCTAHLPQE